MSDLTDLEYSEIAEFYRGKSVLITGSTGFVGRVLLEKLLRSCPGLKTAYVLMRPKKDQEPRFRLEQIVNSQLFAKVRKEQPEVRKKIVIVDGDVSKASLGLSNEDQEKLINNVHVVFHSAATVRFADPLKTAVRINLLGTKRVLDLCHKMKQCMAFVYVSTAYSFCPRQDVIEEKVYPSPFDPHKVIDTVEWMDDKLLATMTPHLLGEWPNTYTFSKALAENLINMDAGSLPTAIVRPSIVTPIWREPLSGWADSINGLSGVYIACGKGILRSMVCYEMVADMIPVDLVANHLIVAGWQTAITRPRSVIVYNCTSEPEKTHTWKQMIEAVYPICLRYPSMEIFRYPGGGVTSSHIYHKIYIFFQHLLPAFIYDTVCYIIGQKPFLMNVYRKIHYAIDQLVYFTTHEWKFSKTNSHALEAKLSKNDKKIFSFDIMPIHLMTYWESCFIGGRKFILHEELSTLPLARKKLKRKYYVTLAINGVVFAGLFHFVVSKSDMASQLVSAAVSSIWNIASCFIPW